MTTNRSIFEILQGTRGETASSAFLAHLMETEAAGVVADYLWQGHGINAWPAKAECEVSTGSMGDRGRIDVSITATTPSGDVTLYVENKHWAALADEQPRKYWDDLTRREQDEKRRRLVVLVPESRLDEAIQHCKERCPEAVVLDWETLLRTLVTFAKAAGGTRLSFLIEEFDHWMRESEELASLETFLRKHREALHRWEPPLQRNAVNKLWRLFPNGSNALNNSNWYVGYYFGPVRNGSWFGFVDGRGSDPEGRTSFYVLAYRDYPALTSHRGIQRSSWLPKRFLDTARDSTPYTWRFDLEEIGNDADAWRAALAPLRTQEAMAIDSPITVRSS